VRRLPCAIIDRIAGSSAGAFVYEQEPNDAMLRKLVRFSTTDDDWTSGSAAPNRTPPRYLSLISLGVG